MQLERFFFLSAMSAPAGKNSTPERTPLERGWSNLLPAPTFPVPDTRQAPFGDARFEKLSFCSPVGSRATRYAAAPGRISAARAGRSEEHTSELQSLRH